MSLPYRCNGVHDKRSKPELIPLWSAILKALPSMLSQQNGSYSTTRLRFCSGDETGSSNPAAFSMRTKVNKTLIGFKAVCLKEYSDLQRQESAVKPAIKPPTRGTWWH